MKKVLDKPLNMFAVGITVILLLCGMLMPLSAGCGDKVLTNDNNQEEENNSPEDAVDIPELDEENCSLEDAIDMPELDEEIVQRIMRDWQEQFGSTLIVNYYGVHNGYVAFFIPGIHDVVSDIMIAGSIFRYSTEWEIYLWKEGLFYDMVGAYQQGLLTSQNVKDLSNIHRSFMRIAWLGDGKSFCEWYFRDNLINSID
ncbi:MAG: hypothetical protein FWH42_02810 [Dehalococcoidia bacterium]|nr:hypothetical protein [Dehalococcoidia bacterium]